ncbi:CUE domain-containing protein 1 isoform X1 [Drosophila albomicans]|uniref:CUE domain-containing protein 1 isoform X1 n=1 Tax=Drosophila albomicans TaxID=7291 RepID=A0A6P8X138_DROAB|nr:CUE domain-containing protein 1 isoform X1 [Drosophila albomicans]
MATSTLQLEFSQAMADFKKMFPDIDREVIEAVLRANLGAVDQTIDQLLAMSTDNQNEKLRNELDANVSPQQSLINLNDPDKELRRNQQQQPQLIDTTDGVASNTTESSAAAAAAGHTLLSTANTASPHHNTGASPKQRPLGASNKLNASGSLNNTPTKRSSNSSTNNTNRRWNPPILGVLPAGFLRITPAAGQQDFELPDEQFALMLQNEEFMNQLRWNQDFMNALEKEQSGKSKGEDDAPFQERLKNMGKMSRKKFLQMARVFTWQRNKKVTTAKQIDSLPLREEPSDDEDHHHHHQQHQQQQQQQQQQSQEQHSQQQSQVQQQQQGQLQLRK